MNFGRIRALTVRIIRQFRRDPRTLGLLFVVPVLVLSLLGYIYRGSEDAVELAISGELESPVAVAIVERLHGDDRLQVEERSTVDAEDALENQEVDGVLVLPSDLSLQPDGSGQVRLVLEGSNPSRAGRIIDSVSQAIPAVALQAMDLDGSPLEINAEFLHGGPDFDQLDFLAPVFIGFFAFFFVFLLTSVSFLRERMQGSIERLMVSPISRPEIVTGYMIGFSLFAAMQSAVIIGFSVFVLNVHYIGNLGYVFLVTFLLTIGSVNLGIFLSTFARTELQVVQFIPVIIVPQGLLSGMIWPVDTMPEPLYWLAHALPLTYANEALRGVMIRGSEITEIALELGILTGFAVLMVLLGSLTLRREVA